jgi:hypothetical protein
VTTEPGSGSLLDLGWLQISAEPEPDSGLEIEAG